MPDLNDFHAFNSTSGGSSGGSGGSGGVIGCGGAIIVAVGIVLLLFIFEGASWDAIDCLLGLGFLAFLFAKFTFG